MRNCLDITNREGEESKAGFLSPFLEKKTKIWWADGGGGCRMFSQGQVAPSGLQGF